MGMLCPFAYWTHFPYAIDYCSCSFAFVMFDDVSCKYILYLSVQPNYQLFFIVFFLVIIVRRDWKSIFEFIHGPADYLLWFYAYGCWRCDKNDCCQLKFVKQLKRLVLCSVIWISICQKSFISNIFWYWMHENRSNISFFVYLFLGLNHINGLNSLWIEYNMEGKYSIFYNYK